MEIEQKRTQTARTHPALEPKEEKMTEREYMIISAKAEKYALLKAQQTKLQQEKQNLEQCGGFTLTTFYQSGGFVYNNGKGLTTSDIPGFEETLKSCIAYEIGRLQTEMENISLVDDGQTEEDHGLEELEGKTQNP